MVLITMYSLFPLYATQCRCAVRRCGVGATTYACLLAFTTAVLLPAMAYAANSVGEFTLQAGHPSLQVWLLENSAGAGAPDEPELHAQRVALGQALFFEPHLSGDNKTSCGTCHIPDKGWTNGGRFISNHNCPGRPKRATPSIVNTAFCSILHWDGKVQSLEEQALMVIKSECVMDQDMPELLSWLENDDLYRQAFSVAYPTTGISEQTLANAIATFERSLIAAETAFDHWVRGEAGAMSEAQVRGFEVFLDEDKGNCLTCHHPPHFSDDGFHNIGLASFGEQNPDLGRYKLKPVAVLKGAFKTPTLRNVSATAPYFHDNSAPTLLDVIDLYIDGGIEKSNLSPDMKAIELSQRERDDLLAFLHALTDDTLKTYAAPAVRVRREQEKPQ